MIGSDVEKFDELTNKNVGNATRTGGEEGKDIGSSRVHTGYEGHARWSELRANGRDP